MSIDDRAVTIGLTAPFGAGCTTAAEILRERLAYTVARLSEPLAGEWHRDNNLPPTRTDLQDLGNRLRREQRNPGVLAEMAVSRLHESTESHTRIVLDGIRNTGEIEFLRERFSHRFCLFALECPTSDRWERLRPRYDREGRSRTEFLAEDERDRNQEYLYGQQVQPCVDLADVFLINDNQVTMHELTGKLTDCVGLVTGASPRCPTGTEILMNLAYSAAQGSRCPKRQVGAVLVSAAPDEMGEIVGQGFNENPLPTRPCVEEREYGADSDRNVMGTCYRDLVRADAFKDLAKIQCHCPQCGEVLEEADMGGPPWRCGSCQSDLEKYFWPERALSLCTAIHAEAAAISVAGARSRGATLYTTTFPCFQCAEKITQAGVKSVVFTEPYPDIRAAHRLKLAKIEVVQFEGVRSRKFHEIFSRARRGGA
jgi:deoxycytidylate deaminase